MSEYVFRRIRGRIVPIKKKDVMGAGFVSAAGTIGAASGVYAADQIKKSNKAYGISARTRGMARLTTSRTSTLYSKLIKDAAIMKTTGKIIANRGFRVLGAGTVLSGLLAGYGTKKIMEGRKPNDEVGAGAITAVGAAASGVGLAIFAKKAKLGNIVKMAKSLNPKNPIKEVYNQWQKFGMRRTKMTVDKFKGAHYKGVKPKPKDIFKAKQQDIFDVKKWMK